MCKSSEEKPVDFSGRPWKYSSKKKLKEDIEAYFSKCEERKKTSDDVGLGFIAWHE